MDLSEMVSPGEEVAATLGSAETCPGLTCGLATPDPDDAVAGGAPGGARATGEEPGLSNAPGTTTSERDPALFNLLVLRAEVSGTAPED